MTEDFAELDATFPTGSDPGDAMVVEAASFEPPTGRFVVIRDRGTTIGCAALQTVEPMSVRSSGCGSPPTGAAAAIALHERSGYGVSEMFVGAWHRRTSPTSQAPSDSRDTSISALR